MRTFVPAMAALLAIGSACAGGPPVERVGEIELPGVSGRIDHMAAESEGAGRLYVAALGNGSVEVVDLSAGARVRSITGLKEPQGVAAAPHRLFVACAGDGAVHAYDTETFEARGTVKLGDDADNMRFDAERGLVFVGYGDGAVAALDAATLEKKAEVRLPAHPESFQLEPAGKRVFINTPGGVIGGGGSVAVADRDTGSILATWKLSEAGRNFPMAADATRLYIGCRRPARLLVLDTQTGRVVASPECVGDADDVFVDGDRVYVSGGDGKLDVFTRGPADRYERATIETAPGARTSLLVPGSSRLYVAAPARDGRPARLIVYSVGGAAR